MIGLTIGTSFFADKIFAIPSSHYYIKKPLRIGFITDLHHLQFGQSEDMRMKIFMDEVVKTSPDFIIQCGDFCRPKGSENIMKEWNRFNGPKYHVLGNHDMDVCNKETIMKLWGMEKRYYSFDQNGFHFVIIDRNFLKQDDGNLVDYNTDNFGPAPSPKRNFSDKEQLEWLKQDLESAKYPVIVFMHQPVFITDFYNEIGNADEILQIFDDANFNATKNGSGKVAAVFMGHDHDDRYGERNGVHYFIINSSTYVYADGQPFYFEEPLYAFINLDPKGTLSIEGKNTKYKNAPDSIAAKFPTKISDHHLKIS